MRRLFLNIVFAMMVLVPVAATAQTAAAPAAAPSATSLQFAKVIANACLPGWETQTCIKALAQSSYVMVSNYGGTLEERNMKADAETLKQHCAATTAATQQDVPAYAQRSAMTECANTISDLVEKTKIAPDMAHYQLMVIPTLCLSKDPSCAAVTEQLKTFAGP